MVEEPELPLEPEAPQLIVWARWLVHYARYEGAVIRKAPVAFCLGVLIIGTLIFFGLQWHNAGVDATKDATIEDQRAHIATLEEELKGASPQLAAIEARRAKVRDQLQKMYIAAGPLMHIDVPPPSSPKFGYTAEDIKKIENQATAAADEWEKDTADWLETNLGPAAKARFLDISNMPIYGWTFNGIGMDIILSQLMNRLANERKNLAVLIETSAYDR